MRSVLATVAVVGLAALSACGGAPTLHVLTWADYVDPEVYRLFEAETGARVDETVFASNEDLRGKLQAGAEGYDVVCPTDYMVSLLVQDGLLREIDPAKLPNLRNVAARFRDPPYDRGHRHSVPFQWGITGIGWNADERKDAPTSWKDLFDPARIAPHTQRISVLDDERELTAAALLSLGKSPNSRDPADLRAAEELLLAQRDHVLKYDSNDFGTSVATGEAVLAQGWSGTFAAAAVDSAAVRFTVPDEGTLQYVDNWAVPKNAPRPDLAELFLDFMLRPDIAALNVNAKRYASCNEAARASIDPAILDGIAYDDGDGKPLHWLEDMGDAAPIHAEIWKRLKAR